MKPIAPKITGDTYTAEEFEDRDTELENAVSKSGQSLSQAKDIQLSRAMNINGIAAQTYQDSGTVNAVKLTPITGISGLVTPESYTQYSGAIVEFNKTSPNTSTTVTVNIGQDTGSVIGAKPLKRLDGTDPSIGEVTGWLRIRFDFSADQWRIIGSIGASFLSEIVTASKSVPTPDTTNRFYNVDATSGDVTITFPTVVGGDISKKIIVQKSVDVANDVIIAGVFDEDYNLRFEEAIIFSTQEITTGVYGWVVEKQDSQTQVILEQQDFEKSILQPDNTNLFEFSSLKVADYIGNLPIRFSNIVHINQTDTTNRKHDDRGVLYNNTGCIAFNYSWGNSGFIKIRIKPDWAFDVATDQWIVDSRSGGGSDDSLYFTYKSSTDTFYFFIQDDVGNKIEIESAAFTTSVSLQVWHDVVIAWDKGTNYASFWLNGIKQTGGTGTTGAGITNINIIKTEIDFGSNSVGTFNANMYFTDFLLSGIFDESTTNYDGGTVLPYFNYDRVAYKNHNAVIDKFGNAGFTDLFIQNLWFLESSVFGKIISTMEFEAKKNPGFIWDALATEDSIFNVLSPLIPEIDDEINVNGSILGVATIIITRAKRLTTTTLGLIGMRADNGVLTSTTITDADATALPSNLSW